MKITERDKLVEIVKHLENQFNYLTQARNRITLDGNGKFYKNTEWISPSEVLKEIHYCQVTIEKAKNNLDNLIWAKN